MQKQLFIIGVFITVLLTSCEKKETDTSLFNDTSFLSTNIEKLASDEFMGREPFTEGEEITVNYLASVYKKIGLEPAFGDSYFQDVPCVYVDYSSEETIDIKSGNKNVQLFKNKDFIAQTPHLLEEVNLENSDLIFAGYGIVAPEYNWNDYEGLDVKGKTVLVLVNDPGFATQDKNVFKGNAMTYYGRWSYKYEEAARQGAKGVMVIHNTDAAGYEFKVLTNTANSNIYLQAEDKNINQCTLTGWITEDAVSRIFDTQGLDFNTQKANALNKDFKTIDLKSALSVHFKNKLTFKNTKNVVGLIKGSKRPEENIVFTAHWDHFGHGPAQDNDSIYNGAADNATAIAAMLQTAKVFSETEKNERTLVFAAVTAEESGLLGSKFLAENYPFPLNKTVANLNYELLLPIGKMKDVTVTGFGQSELETYVEQQAKKQDRYIVEEPFPENGMYYRSDHFSFARAGVPSLFIKGWQDSREHGKEWAKEQIKDYWATKYHKPADEFNAETANLEGIMEDAELFYEIGKQLSNETTFPNWNSDSEFKAIRDKQLN